MSAMPTSPLPATQISFHNILFATDFSDFAERAMPYVVGLARRYGATVFVIHAVPPEPRLAIPLDALPIEFDQARYHAETAMTQFLKIFPSLGVHFVPLIEKGDVEVVFPQTVADHNIDLIVLATHGRRGVGRLVFGSVAEEVFRAVSCPVLIIGPDVVHNELASGEVAEILCATDFSPTSVHALHYGFSLARQFHAHLTILNVVAQLDLPLSYWDSVAAQTHEQLRALIPNPADLPFEPQCVVKFGDAAEEIVSLAGELRCSLIILGARQTRLGRFAAHLPWGVAHQVATDAACPLLTVRQVSKEAADQPDLMDIAHVA